MKKNLNLYNKYRPQCFNDIIGQDIVKNLLYQTFISTKTIQSFIFFGSNGTGKTSVARIFAKSFNCLNFEKNNDVCNECSNCKLINSSQTMDICEVDAASHTGVDHMRELIQNSHYMALDLRKKVYVIDECHNLSSASWSALLKTIEEPPSENVIFIFLTTNIHKIPDTIISRCQKYNFSRIQDEFLIELIDKVSAGEGREFSPEAKEVVAVLSNGSARECLSLIETAYLGTESDYIDLEDVENIFSLSNKQEIMNLSKLLFGGKFDASLKLVDGLVNTNKNLLNFSSELLATFMDMYVYRITSNKELLRKLSVEEVESFSEYSVDLMKYMEILEKSIAFYEKTHSKQEWIKLMLFRLWECSKGKPKVEIKKEEVEEVIEEEKPKKKASKKSKKEEKAADETTVTSYFLPKHLELQAIYGLCKDKLNKGKSIENKDIWRDYISSDIRKSEDSDRLKELLGQVNEEFSFLISDRTLIIVFDDELKPKAFNELFERKEVKEELWNAFMHDLSWIALSKSQLLEYKQRSKDSPISKEMETSIFDLTHKKHLSDKIWNILTS